MPKGLPKVFKGFRLNAQLYHDFKELTAKKGYTVTAAFEKFMATSIDFGLSFPSPSKTENAEAEARIMLSWLKDGKYWVNLGAEEETSTMGRLLQLLPNVQNAELRADIEDSLKKKP